jgi:selenocysteine lyase/cysteine desulfurase
MLTALGHHQLATAAGTYFDELREREFSRLDAQGHAYLDYTGSALYADSQLRAHHALLREGLFGNPHSDSLPSRASTEAIESARRSLLRFLDADESLYDICFTANTSAAIKLVAESYPFSPQRGLVLSADNHNSVNGIREYARRAGAPVRVLPLDSELRLASGWLVASGGSSGWLDTMLPESPGGAPTSHQPRAGLLAFPAQSNFSGVRHPLTLVKDAQASGYDVLLDIAAFIPSHPFSLRDCPADFVALSFYKLFGYPTGIGALVARKEAMARLRRPWFAGGTVLYASVGADRHLLRPDHEAFEDGTSNFLGIAALDAGFRLLDDVGMPRLAAHVAELTTELLAGFRALGNVRIYGPSDMTARGGTVAFNVSDRHGRPVPFSAVETRARQAGVSLRGGCFCNPGASEAAFGLDPAQTAECLETLGADFTPERYAACHEVPIGAVRASLGLANNHDDIRRAVEVVGSFRE